MSSWTHVNFVAELQWWECKSKAELKEQVEEELGDVGEYIDGSEGGVDWYVNVPSYHTSISFSGHRMPVYHWDTVYLTCAGHLRDRTKEQTEKDIQKFIEKLKRRFPVIRNITYKVYADGEELDYFQKT